MENNHKFYFDYVYYRMTKAYYKWDGNGAITSLIGIAMIQTLTILSPIFFVLRLFFERVELRAYNKHMKYALSVVFIGFLIYDNYKYKDKYEVYREIWKDEPKKTRIYKGILVIFSLILCWAPLALMGVFWK